MLLSLPLSFRSLLDFLVATSTPFQKFVNKNYKRNLEYNIMFFLLTTYFPVFFQISSLIFGYIRRNKAKSYEDLTKQQSKDQYKVNYSGDLVQSVASEVKLTSDSNI